MFFFPRPPLSSILTHHRMMDSKLLGNDIIILLDGKIYAIDQFINSNLNAPDVQTDKSSAFVKHMTSK